MAPRRLLALLLLATPLLARADAAPVIEIVDDARVGEPRVVELRALFTRWAAREYRYLQAQGPKPIKILLSKRAGPGLYVGDQILMPPNDPHEMLETFVHELAHHITGHDSSFFFKEGIATHTLEALFAQDHRIPQSWPQYGQSNDAWVNLFSHRGQLISLKQALAWPRYDGSSAEGDFHSWQVYCMAGSFIGWYIGRYGYDAFLQAFRDEAPGQPAAELEQQWLKSIHDQQLALFDPAQALPQRARYRGFARRLSAAAPAGR
ncbi:MAG: hypothetical protein ACRETN_09165 [Nevskiales bacterium]